MEELNIVVIDFEFTMIHRTSILLVSGAMANIHKDSNTIKLKGNPLVLAKENNDIKQLDKLEIKQILHIFRNKQELIDPIINELNDSILSRTNNLHREYITSYLTHKNKKPIIITWNGAMDKEILKRMNIEFTTLSITCYDKNNNGIFYLKIINLDTKEILSETRLGHFTKNGRLLNLNDRYPSGLNILIDILSKLLFQLNN